MTNSQYELFRDLDRRCIAGGLDEGDCEETVRLKRASIESGPYARNPIVREVLAGETTLVAVYDSFSREFRGLRRLIPHRHSPGRNERLRHLSEIIPNVRHFTRRSFWAMDNPIMGAIYGLLAALCVGLVFLRGDRHEETAIEPSGGVSWHFVFLVVFGVAGFFAGALAMLKYRTRDPRFIHAREAAAYMDINYAYHRQNDDAAWAKFIRMQSSIEAGNMLVADR